MDSGGARDRLSSLGDEVLGHILSFLPAPEAARTAKLSRRWRHVFAAVHTLSFDEAADKARPACGGDADDACSYYDYDRARRPVPTSPFATGVLAALVGRHRGARVGVRTPLRALHVRFDEFSVSDLVTKVAADALIAYAVHDAGDELRSVDLRFSHVPIRDREYTLHRRGSYPSQERDTNKDYYVMPTSLFSCTALRTLRLGPCQLTLPSTIRLPSLDTLHLTGVTGGTAQVQRLVNACPRIADLTLKACLDLTSLSVLDKRLRSLMLKCCHDLARVAVDSSELRTFKYRGAVPAPSFLTMHGPRRVTWCSLDFCGDEASGPAELAELAAFLQRFASTKYMRLKSARLGCNIGHNVYSSSMARFPTLRHLELTGMVPDADTAIVATMARILEWSPSLETLSLFFLPEPVEIDDNDRYYDEDEMHDAHSLSYRHVELPVPEGATIRCLRERTREINFVHYQGKMAQRMLAKFLLCNARVVDEVCGEFAEGPLWIQDKLMEEIIAWTMNKSACMIFL